MEAFGLAVLGALVVIVVGRLFIAVLDWILDHSV